MCVYDRKWVRMDILGVRGGVERDHVYLMLELFIPKAPDDVLMLFANRMMCVQERRKGLGKDDCKGRQVGRG